MTIDNHMLINSPKDRLITLKACRDILEINADAFASILGSLNFAKDEMLEANDKKTIEEFSAFASKRLLEIVTEIDIYLAEIATIEKLTGDGL